MTRTRFTARSLSTALAAACLCATAFAGAGPKNAPQQATAGDGAMSAQARYQKERAACLNGTNQQDQKTCLKEAGAAYNEARKGELGDGGAANAALEANARKRCEPLPAADRQACMARMDGAGVVIGSAPAGGIYRELTTVEPATK